MPGKKVELSQMVEEIMNETQHSYIDALNRKIRTLNAVKKLSEVMSDTKKKDDIGLLTKSQVVDIKELIRISDKQKELMKKISNIQEKIKKNEEQLNRLLEEMG